ncbi:MAG: phospholipase D-like domain-containing protein [Prochloraceae cyanobacterium]
MKSAICSKVFSFLIVSLLILLGSCQKEKITIDDNNKIYKDKIDRPAPLPQDPLIQVYFNHNISQGVNYTDPYRKITRPGDNLEAIIIREIEAAKNSIELAVFELNLPLIARSLVKKSQEGVAVKIILDRRNVKSFSQFSPQEIAKFSAREKNKYREYLALVDLNRDGKLNKEEIETRDALIILQNGKIPIIDNTEDGSKGSNLMHQKFIIVDNKKIVTGSANFTLSGIHGDFQNSETRGNVNNLLVIESVELANIFAEEFNLMWGDGPELTENSIFGKKKPDRNPQEVKIGEASVTVDFSPISTKKPWNSSGNGFIAQNLEKAESTVNLALFVFSSQNLADRLGVVNDRGVEIKALFDRSFAFRYYSEGLDLLGVGLRNKKCLYEKNNNPWVDPLTTAGVAKLSRGDKLHHKFAIIDQKIVITGSQNWSAAANYNNDETVLAIASPTVAAHFIREFSRLYDSAVLGVPKYLDRAIAAQERKCS